MSKKIMKEIEGNWSCERCIKPEHVDYLIEQNKRYREVIASMQSEIFYALHSNKSKDVKRFYLENADRFAEKALEANK